MSFWIELHCDAEIRDRKPGCHSDKGNVYGVLVSSGNDALAFGARTLKEDAEDHGWEYRRGKGWFCPVCKGKSE